MVGGLKIILFQKLFLILFYITKLQYKPPGTQKVCLSPPPHTFRIYRHVDVSSQHFWGLSITIWSKLSVILRPSQNTLTLLQTETINLPGWNDRTVILLIFKRLLIL